MGIISSQSFPQDKLAPDKVTGLILAGMGGPDRPTAVEPFLQNLFRDPAVRPFPPLVRGVAGYAMARFGAERIRQRYQQIGSSGFTPLLGWTRQQCSQLAHLLRESGLQIQAAPAMRHWNPLPHETVTQLLGQGAHQFLIVSTFPHFSTATSGTILKATCQAITTRAPFHPVFVLTDWHLLPGYLDSLVRQAQPVLKGWHADGVPPAECGLLYSALAMPRRFADQGDPFPDQVRASVAAVHLLLAARLHRMGNWWRQMPGQGLPLLAYPPRNKLLRWLGPDLKTMVKQLAKRGCRNLLVLPVCHSCEDIDTLYELDTELAQIAYRCGIKEFRRGTALNLDSEWLSAMADLLRSVAFGRPRADAAAAGDLGDPS